MQGQLQPLFLQESIQLLHLYIKDKQSDLKVIITELKKYNKCVKQGESYQFNKLRRFWFLP